MGFIFNNFDSIFNGMLIFQAIMFVFVISFIIYIFYSIFSKKGRSRFVGRQLDISKQVLEDNKELIKDLGELGSEINIQTQRNIYEQNEDDLHYVAGKKADIEAEAIRKKARAFKDGFGDLNSSSTSKPLQKYCKYCGEAIDIDSKYCNKCGERQ